MRKIRELFTLKTIRGKFFALTIVLTIFPMLVLSMVFYHFTANKLIENAENQALSSLQMGEHYMDSLINDLYDMVVVVVGNRQIQNIINQPTISDYEYVRNLDVVEKIMSPIILSKPYISSYLIHSVKGRDQQKFFGGIGLNWILDEDSVNALYQQLQDNNPRLWINEDLFNNDQIEMEDSLILCQLIKDTGGSNEILGFIMIQMDKSKLFQGLTFLSSDSSSQFAILNEENEWIYHFPYTDEVSIQTRQNELSALPDYEEIGSHDILLNGEEYIWTSIINDRSDWKIVKLINAASMYKDAEFIRKFTILLFLLVMVVGLVLAYSLGNSITRPLKQLSIVLKLNAKSTTIDKSKINSNDEIGLMGHRFIQMIEENQQLNRLVYEAIIKRKEAEIQALQAQINPHFLYNTLESLNWLAISRKQYEISEVVISLGKFFRIAISKGVEMITIDKELEHVISYVNVQKFRYKDKIDFIVEFDHAYASCFVPKFILQPLVENSIYHGLKSKEGQGTIMISGGLCEEGLYFQITDDGLGIKPEKLKQIQQALEDDSYREIYGLKNVHERLKIRFGEIYGLDIDSKEGLYTRIYLKIPFISTYEEALKYDKGDGRR